MRVDTGRLDALAADLLAARDENRQIAPISADIPAFGMTEACAIAARVRAQRTARGEQLAGRKIGFTNRTIWDIYGVHGPIWGDMFSSTVHRLGSGPSTATLPALPEMRIEPEIVFGLSAMPDACMDDAELLSCLDWVAHGFEVVSSVFPAWRFAAADAQAAFGLHGALYLGPKQPLPALGPDPVEALSALEITLSGPDTHLVGHGRDVLDGPVQALRHLLTALAGLPAEPPLTPGDIVTTGTLTDARPVHPGDTWQTHFANLALPGLEVTFRP